MLEARTFVDNFEYVKPILEEHGAVFKGEYVIHDKVYGAKGKSLAEEFMRLRSIPKNIWAEKPFIVAIKNTELKVIGKNSVVPLKEQFDTKEEAEEYINKNLLERFEYSYEFERTGWQYDLGDDQVDLEDIEGQHSIEFKSNTEEGLIKLAELLGIKETIKGPSVVAVKELLKR